MANRRGSFRFRIPWLGAAPVPPRPAITGNQTDAGSRPTSEAQSTSSTAATGTRTGLAPTDTETGLVQRPPSSPPRVMPMSPRTVFSPRLIPRLANHESVTTSQLTTPLQSPPPLLPVSLLSSPTQSSPQQPVAATPPQTPPRYFFGASPDRKASPEPPVKPEPEQVTKQDTSPRFQPRQTSEPKTSLEPPLPSEKIVPENTTIVALKPQVGLEKKPEKGKGPLKGENPNPEESRGKSKRAPPIYTFRYKPPPPPPPPLPPPPLPPPPSLQKSIKEDVSKLIHELTTGGPKKYQVGETLVDIVTLAGENKGAVMRLGSESTKDVSVHIRRGYKKGSNSSTEFTSEDEDDKEKFNRTEEESEAEAYVNSNVQGVNNSMVFDSSVSEKNPGVHMAVSVVDVEEEEMSPAAEKLPEKEEALPETRRSEFSPTPAERLTYQQPVVKRRCLRGLFMESSDSDLDDPKKSRRHGCRYGCGEKSKDKGKGINIS